MHDEYNQEQSYQFLLDKVQQKGENDYEQNDGNLYQFLLGKVQRN